MTIILSSLQTPSIVHFWVVHRRPKGNHPQLLAGSPYIANYAATKAGWTLRIDSWLYGSNSFICELKCFARPPYRSVREEAVVQLLTNFYCITLVVAWLDGWFHLTEPSSSSIGRSKRRVVPKLTRSSMRSDMELLLGGFYYNLGKGPFRGMVAKRSWPQGPCWGEPGTLWQSKRDREKMVIVGDCPLSWALLQQSRLATVNMIFAYICCFRPSCWQPAW